MVRRIQHAASVAAVVLVTCGMAASSAAVDPSLSNILPRGGQRGTEIEVRFVGKNLEDAVDVMFHEPGISLMEIVSTEDNAAVGRLAIAPDCSVGTHALRVRTKTGVTNLQLFSVGALTELEEQEPNGDSDVAQAVTINTTVNGVVTNEDVDYFALQLDAGTKLAVEVEALRLGTALFDPKLRLFGPHGHELIAEDDTALMRQDAAFVHTAQETGRYFVAISEASYGGSGGYYYRLHIGDFPRPLGVTPLGVKPGATTRLTWLGDPELDPQDYPAPEIAGGFQDVAPSTEKGIAPTPITLRAASLDSVAEAEPNNSRNNATPGVAPGAFDGVIGSDGDVDWYAFEGKKGAVFDVRVWAKELGSPLDSVLRVIGPNGDGVGGNDDSGGLDSKLRVTLPEDGVHQIMVRDHLQKGGPLYAYRVEVMPVQPSVEVFAQKNESGTITVPQGNRALLLLGVIQRDFSGELEFGIPNLPQGVSATYGPSPQGATVVPVVLHAADDAPVSGALAEIVAAHHHEGGDVVGGLNHSVRLVTGQNQVLFLERRVKHLALAVAEKAPYSIRIVPPKVPVIKGASRHLTIEATRSEGFDKPIHIEFPWLPPGLGAGTAKIEGDQTTAQVLLEAKGGAAVGAHGLVALGKSEGYEIATEFTEIEVSDPWVQFELNELRLEQGQEVEVPLNINTVTPFEGASKIEVNGLPKGVNAEGAEFTKDSGEVVLDLKIAPDAPEGKFGALRIVTHIPANGDTMLHVADTGNLTIFKPVPPELKAPEPEPKKQDEQVKAQPKRRTRFPETAQ